MAMLAAAFREAGWLDHEAVQHARLADPDGYGLCSQRPAEAA
jgi:hypothetical protein